MERVEAALRSYERMLIAENRLERERQRHRANVLAMTELERETFILQSDEVEESVSNYYSTVGHLVP